jgi:hypothetical protein
MTCPAAIVPDPVSTPSTRPSVTDGRTARQPRTTVAPASAARARSRSSSSRRGAWQPYQGPDTSPPNASKRRGPPHSTQRPRCRGQPLASTAAATPSARRTTCTPGCRVSPGRPGPAGALSSTATVSPAAAAVIAAAAPAGPPPTTTTSKDSRETIGCSSLVTASRGHGCRAKRITCGRTRRRAGRRRPVAAASTAWAPFGVVLDGVTSGRPMSSASRVVMNGSSVGPATHPSRSRQRAVTWADRSRSVVPDRGRGRSQMSRSICWEGATPSSSASMARNAS